MARQKPHGCPPKPPWHSLLARTPVDRPLPLLEAPPLDDDDVASTLGTSYITEGCLDAALSHVIPFLPEGTRILRAGAHIQLAFSEWHADFAALRYGRTLVPWCLNPTTQSAHWILLVVTEGATHVRIFDSLARTAHPPTTHDAARLLARAMGAPSDPIITAAPGPQQAEGSNDCAVFVVRNAAGLCPHAPPALVSFTRPGMSSLARRTRAAPTPPTSVTTATTTPPPPTSARPTTIDIGNTLYTCPACSQPVRAGNPKHFTRCPERLGVTIPDDFFVGHVGRCGQCKKTWTRYLIEGGPSQHCGKCKQHPRTRAPPAPAPEPAPPPPPPTVQLTPEELAAATETIRACDMGPGEPDLVCQLLGRPLPLPLPTPNGPPLTAPDRGPSDRELWLTLVRSLGVRVPHASLQHSDSAMPCSVQEAADLVILTLAHRAAHVLTGVQEPAPEYFSPHRESTESALGPDAEPATAPQQRPYEFDPVTMDRIWSARVKTILHIPKRARGCLARHFARAAQAFAATPTYGTMAAFLAAPKLLLHMHADGTAPNAAEIRHRVTTLERRTEEGTHTLLRSLLRPRLTGTVTAVSAAARAEDLARDGEYSRAVAALTSGTVRNPDEQSLADLEALHPRRTEPMPDLPAPARPTPVSTDEALRALRSFGRRTSPGACGMRPEHLLECIKGDVTGSLLFHLTSLVNVLRQGGLPPDIAHIVAGATLTGIAKKGGGTRPIAAGETLRRLVAKAEATRAIPKARTFLEPYQMGVGTPLGTERIARLADIWRRKYAGRKGRILLKVDIRNAFNSVARARIIAELHRRHPELVSWVRATYEPQSWLQYGPFTIISDDGVQQGDPLGPLLFAIALQPLIDRIAHEVPDLDLHKWYLDDGVLAGSVEDVLKALNIILEVCPGDHRGELGLSTNIAKCELVTMNADTDTSAFPEAIQRVHGNFDLLGVPLGSDEWTADYIATKALAKADKAIAGVQEIADPQVAYTLLRDCCGFPRIVHIIRTLPPSVTRPALKHFDECIRQAATNIIGAPIPEVRWEPATWGTSRGGLGLRGAAAHAAAAYVASTIECAQLDGWDPRELQEWAGAIGLLNVGLPPKTRLDYEAPTQDLRNTVHAWVQDEDRHGHSGSHKGRGKETHLQRAISRAVEDTAREALVAGVHDPEYKGHLMRVGTPEAGTWLRAVPSKTLFTALQPREFRAAVLWRLYLFQAAPTCPHCRQNAPHPNGRHLLTCRYGGGITARHDALRNQVLEAATTAGYSACLEVQHGTGKQRPGDVVIRGSPATFVDVAVMHPLQPRYAKQAADGASPPDAYARTVKDAKYKKSLQNDGLLFLPFVADVYGNLSTEASALVRRLGRARAIRENEHASRNVWILRVRIGFTIMAAVAKMLVAGEAESATWRGPGGAEYGPTSAWYAATIPGPDEEGLEASPAQRVEIQAAEST